MKTNPRTIKRGGKTYVLVEQAEYERMLRDKPRDKPHLPPLPEPDAEGNVPALEFTRASIARHVITRRQSAGLSQTELAKRAGIRVETLNRIENGRHTADVATIAKIEAALHQVESPTGKVKRAAERTARPTRRAS